MRSPPSRGGLGTAVAAGAFTVEAESIGGFGIIDARDLDEVLAMVRSWPIGGYIEIRPIAQPGMWSEIGSPKTQPGEIA